MAIPASNAGKHVGEDQANTFSDTPNERCTFQTWTPCRCFQCSQHTQTWSCKCKLLNVWVRRKINFGSKRTIFSTLLWCSVLMAPFEPLLCQPSPESPMFASVRAETEPGKYQQLWKPPSSSRLLAQPVCCKKKNPYSLPSPILLIGPRFAQTGNCY